MRKRLIPFLNPLKNWLVSDHKILILSLIIACLSFPGYALYYLAGIDEPLPWVFNYFADGHYGLAKNLLFPHGPLAFLIYPLPMGNNLAVTILVTLFCSMLFSVQVLRIYFLQKKENYLLPTVLLLIIQSVCDIQLLLIGLTLTHILLFELNGKKLNLALALFFCVLNLYIKTYGGMICLLLLAFECLRMLFIKKDFKICLFIMIGFFLYFFLFRLALFHTLSGSLSFLYGQYQLSADNSEAAAFYNQNNWWLLSACIISLLAIPFVVKEKFARFYCLLMLLPLFAAWKHSVTRTDEAHLWGFVSFLMLFSFLLLLLYDEKKIVAMILCFVAIAAFTLNVPYSDNEYATQKNIALFRPFNLYNLVTQYDSVSNIKNRYSADRTMQEKLPDTLLKIIGKKTADVFPWNYALIAANKLNWAPRPTLHSYAMYTSWLDEQNAAHISSGNSAHFLIWETGQKVRNMMGIDSRYLLNDGPRTILALFSNYSLRFKNESYLVFEKQAVKQEYAIKKLSGPEQVKYDEWVEVPAPAPGCIVRARLCVKKSFLGRIKSTLFKGEAFILHYETHDGKELVHKIVPRNAADGLWINPLIMTPENDAPEPLVKRIKLACTDVRMVQPEYSLEFEQVGLKNGSDILQRAFHKTSIIRQFQLPPGFQLPPE